MTGQQIDREMLRAEAAQNAPHGMVISTGEALALLDQLDQAEARIKAVRDVLDTRTAAGQDKVRADLIRRALDG